MILKLFALYLSLSATVLLWYSVFFVDTYHNAINSVVGVFLIAGGHIAFITSACLFDNLLFRTRPPIGATHELSDDPDPQRDEAEQPEEA